ncbi:uncharacterized protein [Amphiura filiformis]|uniref:uncharacterized protein isoform X1 n=1 Tax=Amphiura filiformis TaxID=82378 RepID=UPI003B21226E
MKFILVVVAVILVAGVSSAPLVKRSLEDEQKLRDLLMQYLDGNNAQIADEQADDTAAVLEEEREENEQIDQVVEKEEDGLGEALFKAAQLEKKNDKKEEQKLDNREQQLETELENEEGELETTLEEREKDILENIERELLLIELKKELSKKSSGGVQPGK